jgi:hypothetical protein
VEKVAERAERSRRWVSGDGGEDSPRRRHLLGLDDHQPGNVVAAPRGAPSQEDPLVAYEGHHWRLRADGSLRRWDATTHGWSTLSRERWSVKQATYLTLTEIAEGRAAPDFGEVAPAAGTAALEGCTCLGGDLPSLCLYGRYSIALERDGISLRSPQGGTMTIPLGEVVDVGVGGRGPVDASTNGRESFAIAGALDGMAPAAVVRSLVVRTGMDTSITIETTGGKAVFHCDRLDPDRARLLLTPVIERLQRRHRADAGRVDPTRDLVALADLKERGLLTDQEFASAVDAALQGTL